MLLVEIDKDNRIAMLEPRETLSKSDFESATETIDRYIENYGTLNGLVIHTKFFPGWDSFAALCAHLKFIKGHHKKIARIALSTDSALGQLAEKIAKHFINAEIKIFSFQGLELAQ